MDSAHRWRGGKKEDYWMPDDKCSKCLLCESAFTLWRRRHHCRVCGRIFCSDCSSKVISGLTLGNDSPDPVRACDVCYKQRVQAGDASEPPDPVPGARATPPITPEPEPEPGMGSSAAAMPLEPGMGSSAAVPLVPSGPAEDLDDGDDDYPAELGGLEAVDVPLPAAPAPDAEALQDSRQQLTEAAQARLVAIVSQLLRDEELDDEWTEQVVGMATRAIDAVNTDPDNIDFQRFVHVKRIAGGTIVDESPRGAPVAEGWGGLGCGFTDGVVARKTVAHNKMPTDIKDPRIMLVRRFIFALHSLLSLPCWPRTCSSRAAHC